MILSYLLNPWIKKGIPNIKILDLTLDSRNTKYGSLFFAISGYLDNGNKYIKKSINLGAKGILVETNFILEHGKIINYNNIPIIFFYNLKLFISEISGRFYNNPSHYIKLIGITGTNGKTTISYILSQLINLIGDKSAIIGTLGNGIIGNLIKTKNTTDSSIELQKTLNTYNKLGINIIFLEVSSHSLSQNRVKNLKFEYAIYTNISHDHLNYHKNMFYYKLSKYKLFSKHKIKKSIINIDDNFGKEISKKIENCISVSLFNPIFIESKSIYLKIEKIKFFKDRTLIKLITNYGVYYINLNFIGNFNISNFMLSLVTLLDLGYSLKDLIKLSFKIKLPKGRMEKFIHKNNISIIVDYAHTPDAMENVFKTINRFYKKKIWCIFGCGGNKDVYKRPIMGNIAEKYSDYLILTNDNPEYECPKKIINDIKIGIKRNKNVFIILNRENAIKYSMNNSNNYDIILIFGKGHENYQLINNKRIFYSDQKIIMKFLK